MTLLDARNFLRLLHGVKDLADESLGLHGQVRIAHRRHGLWTFDALPKAVRFPDGSLPETESAVFAAGCVELPVG